MLHQWQGIETSSDPTPPEQTHRVLGLVEELGCHSLWIHIRGSSITREKKNYAKKNCSRNRLEFFDQHDLQSLNNCSFVFDLGIESLGIWERVIYRWKGLENYFPEVYYTPQKIYNSVAKRQKKNYVVV